MAKQMVFVRMDPPMIAALHVIVSYMPGDRSDHIRTATGRYIESELAALTSAVGQGDTMASRRLAELRAAYTSHAD